MFFEQFSTHIFDKYNKRISHTQLPLLIKNGTTITNNKNTKFRRLLLDNTYYNITTAKNCVLSSQIELNILYFN